MKDPTEPMESTVPVDADAPGSDVINAELKEDETSEREFRGVLLAESSVSPSPLPEPLQDTAPPLGNLRGEIYRQIPMDRRSDANMVADWLAMPEDAKYLRIVLESVWQRLSKVEEVADASFLELPAFLRKGTEAWQHALLSVSHWGLRLKDVMGTSGLPRDQTRGVQKSGQHLYACQPYGGPPTHEAQFENLQAQVMVAAWRSWDELRQRYFHGLATPVDKAAASVRQLKDSLLISRLPTQVVSQATYHKEIAILLSEPGEDALPDKEKLSHIESLLRKVEDPDDDQLARNVPPSSYADDELDLPANVQIRKDVRISNETYADLIQSGMPLEELAGDIEEFMPGPTVLARPPDQPRQRVPSTAELVRNRSYQIAALERANQRLPGAWSRLRRHEVSAWLHAVFDQVRPILRNRGMWSESETECVEAAVQLSVSFWTSRTVNESAKLMLYASRAHLPQQGSETIGFILASNQWCIPRLRPKARPLYRNADFALAEESASVMLLPVHPATSRMMQRLPAAAEALSTGSAPAFTTEAEPRNELIEQLANTRGLRTTSTRIADYVFHRLSDVHGDIAAASLTLGHAHRLSDTALHYANYPQAHLAQNYAEICAAIYDEAFEDRKATADIQDKVIDPESCTPHTPKVKAALSDRAFNEPALRIGTEICPLPASQQRLRNDVLEAFRKVVAAPGRTDYLADHHNLFILYTLLMLKAATGYRDVLSPLPRRSDINLQDQTILVSDKDDAASFNSRVLPLATMVADQLKAVDAHLNVLASRLVLADSTLARDLYEQTGQLEGLPSPYPKHYHRAPPLFFLQRHGRSLCLDAIRPTTLKARLATDVPWFRLPTNTSRAYVRNRLLNGIDVLDSCLPGAAVDYFMGHWVRGREPLGRFATLPVERYIELLRPALNRLLVHDGWSTISGCHD